VCVCVTGWCTTGPAGRQTDREREKRETRVIPEEEAAAARLCLDVGGWAYLRDS